MKRRQPIAWENLARTKVNTNYTTPHHCTKARYVGANSYVCECPQPHKPKKKN